MMNRRGFLHMAVVAAAALSLPTLGVVAAKAEPETLFGFPIKYEKPGTTVHTEWIDCGSYEDVALIPGSIVALGNLEPLDWTVRVVYTEEDEPRSEPSIPHKFTLHPDKPVPEFPFPSGQHALAGTMTNCEWYDTTTNAWHSMADEHVKLIFEPYDEEA